MNPWIKRTLVGLFGAAILVGGLATCGHRPHGFGANLSAEESAQHRAKMVERVSGKLDLNTDQKQRLSVLGDKLHAQRLALMGQASDPAATRLVFDGLVIDSATRSVLRRGQEVELTGTEFDLLQLLAREAGKVFSRDDILNHLRGHEVELYTRAVDIVVSRLRKKLEPLDCIKTLRNAGYSLALGRLLS